MLAALNRFWRVPLSFSARATAGAGALVIAASAYCLSPWGNALDQLLFDSLFALRGPIPASEDVLIVAIDEPSFQHIDRQWPWPRWMHAHLIDELFDAGAKVVALDIVFAEPSSGDQDRLLRSAISRHPNVVLATDFNTVSRRSFVQETQVGPAPGLVSSATRLGRINHRTDSDGFIRRLELPRAPPALMAWEVARAFDPGCCTATLTRGVGPLYINYRGPPGTVSMVSYYQAIERERFLPPGIFNGKVVFVGLVTTSTADPQGRAPDHFPIPYTRFGHGYDPGVDIHANATMSLLADDVIVQVSRNGSLVAGLLLGLALITVFRRVRPGSGAVIVVLILSLLGVVTLYLFTARYHYLSATDLTLPLLAAYALSPFQHYASQRRQRLFIEQAFSAYLAPTVVRQLIEHPEMLKPGGQSVDATILFLDIEGFTALSEQFEPAALIQIMNRFMGVITDEVLNHDGMIDKFIGDAVMAVWGAPIRDVDHAEKACAAAISIARSVKQCAREEVARSGARIRARIGVNSGTVVAGNVGGEKRFDYTVLGNDVNLASRLEGANKEYGTEILVGEVTARMLSDRFALREIDCVRVKGKTEPIRIYELQGEAAALSPRQQESNRLYAEGLTSYRAGEWDTAMSYFAQVTGRSGADGPSETLSERARRCKSSPPPPDWGGVFDMQTK